jgi:hypothetical protein
VLLCLTFARGSQRIRGGLAAQAVGGTPVLPVSICCRSFASSLLDISNFHVPKSIMTTSKLPELNNGILTTWLPLTTPGPSVSAACSSEIYVVPLHTTLAAFDPWYGQNVNSELSCLAAEETLWWDQSQGPSTTTFLGPFACPNGHTTAATSLFREGTTLVGCCPS